MDVKRRAVCPGCVRPTAGKDGCGRYFGEIQRCRYYVERYLKGFRGRLRENKVGQVGQTAVMLFVVRMVWGMFCFFPGGAGCAACAVFSNVADVICWKVRCA